MTKNKREVTVLLAGSYPPPHGGQSVHIQQLFLYLTQCGVRVGVLNLGTNKQINHDGIININSSKHLLKTLLFSFNVKVLHLHVSGLSDFGKLVPVLFARLFKKFRWIITIHTGNIETILNKTSIFERLIIRIVLYKVNKLICVNQAIKDCISQWIDEGKLFLIPAFSINFHESKLPEGVEAFFSSHTPVISCVGFYEPVYGFELAIAAIKRLKEAYNDIGLIIVGDKKGSEPYEAMIKDNRIGENVFLTGNLSHDVCLSIIKRSSVFLRPTLYDGDSISVREALTLQIPVIASDTEYRPAGVKTFETGNLGDMFDKTLCSLNSEMDRTGIKSQDERNLKKTKELYGIDTS